MARLVLVRHGQAAAAWDADHDPGLDEQGGSQAAAVAEVLAAGERVPILASPLLRTRETAAPLERRWSMKATVEPGVGEIPSPIDDLGQRGAWLREVMQGTWSDLDATSRDWRDNVVATVRRIAAEVGDAVVFTHFVAINVVVGAATGDDRVVVCAPDHCSRTVIEVDTDGSIELIELGGQAQTIVR